MSDAVVRLSFPAKSDYLLLARLALSGIARDVPMDDDLLADLKLAVTEACGNAVRHAYPDSEGDVCISYAVDGRHTLVVTVEDQGAGLEPRDIRERSATPLESGMGMSIIGAIVDHVDVFPGADGRGTVVRMTKSLVAGSDEKTDAAAGTD